MTMFVLGLVAILFYSEMMHLRFRIEARADRPPHEQVPFVRSSQRGEIIVAISAIVLNMILLVSAHAHVSTFGFTLFLALTAVFSAYDVGRSLYYWKQFHDLVIRLSESR
jgi:hypothetical protein